MDIKQLQALAGVNEASVNISLNGTNSQEIKDLMGIFQKDERAPLPPTGIAKPPMSMDMPGMDIDVAPPIGLDGPLPPMPPPSLDKPMDLDGPSPCSTCGGIHSEEEECGEGTEWDNAPKEKYNDADFMTKDIAGGINGPKNPKDIRVKDPSSMAEYKQYLLKKLKESTITNEVNSGDWIDDDNPCASTKGLMHKICMRRHKAKQKNLQKNSMYSEEQTFSGRSDRTYFIVPNDEDYMDIQDDNRFAGDIEVPDENADIMALPNSKFRKLKMMYGNKILDLGTDYDAAVEREEQKAKRRHLAGISRTKAGGSAGRRSDEGSAADAAFADMDAELGKTDDHGLGDMGKQMRAKAQARRNKGTIPKNPNRVATQKRAADDAFADMDKELKASMYAEDMNRIRELSGLNETKKKELNEWDPRKAYNNAIDTLAKAGDDVGNAVTGAGKAVGDTFSGAAKKVGDTWSGAAKQADTAISNLKKNAGIGSQQQQQKAAPQAKPDKMVTKPGEVMKWKNPKTGKLELYIFVEYPATSINRNAGALNRRVKLGIAADQKTINFKPGEKLEGGAIVQPGTKTELYQNLIKTHVDNAEHKMGQKTSGVAGAGTTDLKDAKKWQDMSYEEKQEFYTDQDMEAAKKALLDFAKNNPSFNRDLSMALELNKDGDPEMLQKFLLMGLEREASSESGEQAYLASLKQSDIDTGATATNKNGKGPGTTATVDMGKGIGTTATLGDPNMMGGVA